MRTDAAKRFKKVENATAMIWKLLQVAEKNFRTLKGYWLLPDVYEGKQFVDGVMVTAMNRLEKGGCLNVFYTLIGKIPGYSKKDIEGLTGDSRLL